MNQEHKLGAVTWAKRGSFILAATGSSVGLGNIWKFPYIAGQNGGGAFVLMYIGMVLLVGIPILLAELVLGRRGRASPINTMRALSRETHSSRFWTIIGWMGALCGLMILSFYSVAAGWVLAYFDHALRGDFRGLDGSGSLTLFANLLANRDLLLLLHTVFILMTVVVLALGVKKGLESAIRWMMPSLFALVIVLLVAAMIEGEFAQSLRYMFSFKLSDITWESALIAMGHSFFTLSVGMGAIIAYGAYTPRDMSVGRTVLAVAFLDTCVALGVGVAIFAFVFATPGISPSQGPGLMFVTLPVAFGGLPAGDVIASIFFGMVILAAWTSTISLLEPSIAYLTETFKMHRAASSALLGFIAWLLGVGAALSFNDWAHVEILWGKTFFDTMDFVASNILLPLGGLLIALFVGWRMSAQQLNQEVDLAGSRIMRIWRLLLRYLSPLAILIIFVYSILPVLQAVFGE